MHLLKKLELHFSAKCTWMMSPLFNFLISVLCIELYLAWKCGICLNFINAYFYSAVKRTHMLRRRSALVKIIWKTVWFWLRQRANYGTTLADNYSSISLFQTARDGQYMVEGVTSHASHRESRINSVTRDLDQWLVGSYISSWLCHGRSLCHSRGEISLSVHSFWVGVCSPL